MSKSQWPSSKDKQLGFKPLAGIRVIESPRDIAALVTSRALAVLGTDGMKMTSKGRADISPLWVGLGIGKRWPQSERSGRRRRALQNFSKGECPDGRISPFQAWMDPIGIRSVTTLLAPPGSRAAFWVLMSRLFRSCKSDLLL